MSCWACGSGALGPSAAFAPAPLLECRACGHVFLADADREEVRAEYDEAYFDSYAGEGYSDSEQRRHEARRRLDWMAAWVRPPGRLLEVGAAAGFFLDEARAAGFEVSGVEPGEREAERARSLGLDVAAGFVEDLPLPEDLDAVCGWHVLEHVPQPLATVERLVGALRPGGHVFFEVPNAASTMALRGGAGWPLLGLPGHVSQFSPGSLRALLERGGAEVLQVDTIAVYSYFRARQAFDPRRVAGRAALSVLTRTAPTGRHPSRHELLRVVARRQAHSIPAPAGAPGTA